MQWSIQSYLRESKVQRLVLKWWLHCFKHYYCRAKVHLPSSLSKIYSNKIKTPMQTLLSKTPSKGESLVSSTIIYCWWVFKSMAWRIWTWFRKVLFYSKQLMKLSTGSRTLLPLKCLLAISRDGSSSTLRRLTSLRSKFLQQHWDGSASKQTDGA